MAPRNGANIATIMDAIELAADQEFSYGRGNDAELSTEDIKEQTEG